MKKKSALVLIPLLLAAGIGGWFWWDQQREHALEAELAAALDATLAVQCESTDPLVSLSVRLDELDPKAEKYADIRAALNDELARCRYADELARFLYDRGFEVSVVNPKRIKSYAESKLTRSKTDAVDAAIIEDFCRTQQPRLWKPASPEIEELQMMTRHLEALKRMRTQELNRLKSGLTAPAVQEIIEKHIIKCKYKIVPSQCSPPCQQGGAGGG